MSRNLRSLVFILGLLAVLPVGINVAQATLTLAEDAITSVGNLVISAGTGIIDFTNDTLTEISSATYTGGDKLGVTAATLVVCASDAKSTKRCDYVADGTADNVEIQAAIDALPAGGGRVVLSEGTFSLAARVNINTSNVHLSGQGFATHVQLTGKTFGIWMRGTEPSPISDVTIENLYIEGSGLADGAPDSSMSNVLVEYASRVIVRGLKSEKAVYDSILMHLGTSDTLIEGNIVIGGGASGDDGINVLTSGSKHIIADNIVTGITNDGIHVSGGTGVVISGNTVDSPSGHGITVSNVNFDTSFTITGNTITNVGLSGVAVGDGLDRGATYLRGIVGNNVIHDGGPGTGAEGGVAVRTTAGESTVVGDIAITGNLIKNYSGIQIRAVGSSTNKIRSITINDNIVDSGLAQDAIFVQHANEVQGSGNLIRNDSQQAFQTDTSGNTLLVGNSAYGSGRQFVATNATGTVIIRDNRGWITENSGTATVANGNTSVAVSHGLNVTPSVEDCSVTPTNNLGNATKFWTSGFGASNFTINVDADPGAGTATFAWACAAF